jgi:2-dehydropantoate 2-reductase
VPVSHGQDVMLPSWYGHAGRNSLRKLGCALLAPHGDFSISPNAILASDLNSEFDLILVGTKSYSLSEAMDHFAPAIGATSVILPFLNGMSHLKTLGARFGDSHVIGGTVHISAGLDADGRVLLTAPIHKIFFGEIEGGMSERIRAIASALGGCDFEIEATDTIMQDMWEKWAALASGAGMACLMRGSVGAIMAAGGREAMLSAIDECLVVAAAAGFTPRAAITEFLRDYYTREGSSIKPSMLRDIERGSVTEGNHILASFAAQARALGVATPILDLACINFSVYEAGREHAVT